jgi:Transglutaminase-like superfamily
MKPRVHQRKLRREAMVLIPLAAAAVKLLSAQRILAWAARPLQAVQRFADPDLPALVAAAVQAQAAWYNLAAPCLPTALTVLWMLRRRGVASRLCLGVRRDQSALSAHAWLEIDHNIVFGASEVAYTPVARYGT